MKLKITPFVYPNGITITQTAIVKYGKTEYEAIVEATYTVPEDADNMEIFQRTNISLASLEQQLYDRFGAEKHDRVVKRILKDAEMWTPLGINVHPAWPSDREVLANTIGVKFSKVLTKWVGAKNMQEIVKRNAENNDSSCASHDFCDANMAMDEAFTKVMGRAFEFNFDEDKEKEQGNSDDTDLMNMAWNYAKANNFFIN